MKQVWFGSIVLVGTTFASMLGSESPLPDLSGNPIPRSPDVFVMLSEPKSGPFSNTAAVDAKGIRHRGADYSGKILPWLADTVETVMPSYPYFDWRHRYQGQGLFRVTLDVQTGRVAKIITFKSTGFDRLDSCGIVALQRWRWKPGKWKEVDILVTFTLTENPPRSAVLLPTKN
jgi:outer membrane biosynthesis protein TonB